MPQEPEPPDQAPFPSSNPRNGLEGSRRPGPAQWLWRILVLLSISGVLAAGILFARMSGSDPSSYRNDFNVFYFASREMIAGRTPYEHSLGAWTPYLYPPLLAEILSPVAVLPLPVAAYIWFLINTASLIAAAAMCGSLSAQRSAKDPLPELTDETQRERVAFLASAVGVVVVSRFALDNLAMGQVNLVTTALSVAHLYFFTKQKRVASAAALALAVSIKLTPAILIFFHVARGRLKYAAACAALSAALVLVGFAPFGAQAGSAFETFFDRTVRNGQGYDLAFEGNQSLRGFDARSRHESDDDARRPGSPITLIVSLALLAIAIVAARRSPEESAAAALFFALAPLISPLSWKSHFVVMLLPAAVLAREALRSNRLGRIAALAVLSIAFLLFNATSPSLMGVAAAGWMENHSLIMTGAVLMFFAVAASCLLSSRFTRSGAV